MCERDEDAIRHFRRTVPGQFRLPMLVGLAHALERRGRLPEAREAAERAVGARATATTRCARGRSGGGYIAAVMGDRERARRRRGGGRDRRGPGRELLHDRGPRARRGHFLEAGRPERSLEQARLAGTGSTRPRRVLLVVRAYAELALGRAEAAVELSRAPQALVERLPLQFPRGMVRNARARFALAAGDTRAPPSWPPSTRRSRSTPPRPT